VSGMWHSTPSRRAFGQLDLVHWNVFGAGRSYFLRDAQHFNWPPTPHREPLVSWPGKSSGMRRQINQVFSEAFNGNYAEDFDNLYMLDYPQRLVRFY